MKTYNIPIFVPHKGCPFDCVFCNQKRITGKTDILTANDVKHIIEEYLKTLPKKNCVIEAAFFGGSFTGIPIVEQKELLHEAKEFKDRGEIHGIRLSTRPDYISAEILDNLLNYGVTTIELGVQSMDDGVLFEAGRGHTEEQVREAVSLIKKYPFKLGLQMMTGLPGDTDEKALCTAKKLIGLKPDIVRIYPTLIIRDTQLEDMYLNGKYTPQSLEEAVKLSKKLLLLFEENNINVIRIGLQATDEICENGSVIAGPVHSSFRELVESSIYFDIIKSEIGDCKKADIYVNPSEISKAVGNKRNNILEFKRRNVVIKIYGDRNLGKREVRCVCY